MDSPTATLPRLEDLKGVRFVCSLLAIVTAFVLLIALGGRIVSAVDVWQWWVPVALVMGVVTADFTSGLVHWAADTWGRDDFPVLGPRLLVPFRVHHINPDDFLRRPFVDTNADVALVTMPILLALLIVPLDSASGGPAAVFGWGCSAAGCLTNQVHQWAHRPSPPWLVRVLQACGLLLSRTAHAIHHDRPYTRQYCITTGWCNRPLDAIDFFPRLERLITRLTGVSPRQDDELYARRYPGPDPVRT
jgi:ubiquitin-conjugating enzyme E2 variant